MSAVQIAGLISIYIYKRQCKVPKSQKRKKCSDRDDRIYRLSGIRVERKVRVGKRARSGRCMRMGWLVSGISVPFAPLPPPRASSLDEKRSISEPLRKEGQKTYRPTTSSVLTQARHDHPRPRTTWSHGTQISRA